MLLKRSIKFYLGKVKNAHGSIRMCVTYNGHRVEFQTGVVIGTSSWDKVRCCVISYGSGSSLAGNLNDQLSSMKARMVAIFQEYEIRGIIPTVKELRNSYNGNVSEKAIASENQQQNAPNLSVTKEVTSEKVVKEEKPEMSFWKCYDEFVKVNSKLNDWTDSTREKFAALRNHLYKFKRKLTFEFFTEDGISDLIDYYGKQGFKNSTINKQLSFLRWFLRWAYQKGYNNNRTFEYYKPKLKDAAKRVVFLTPEELDKLEKFKIPEKRKALDAVRDVFLFCCYTGLRHSDVYKLTWADIHDGRIEVVTKKTSDRIYIELNSISKAILEKYKDYHFKNNKALPVISNQKMNDQLHDLCKLAGIDEPIKLTHFEGNKRIDEVKPKYEIIGTHTGRRTFICMALSSGIPPSVVMKWTGHSDYKAMKPYIDITDDAKSMYMKKFDARLNVKELSDKHSKE